MGINRIKRTLVVITAALLLGLLWPVWGGHTYSENYREAVSYGFMGQYPYFEVDYFPSEKATHYAKGYIAASSASVVLIVLVVALFKTQTLSERK